MITAADANSGHLVLMLDPAEAGTLAEILGVAAAGTLTREGHALWCDLLDAIEQPVPLLVEATLRPLRPSEIRPALDRLAGEVTA